MIRNATARSSKAENGCESYPPPFGLRRHIITVPPSQSRAEALHCGAALLPARKDERHEEGWSQRWDGGRIDFAPTSSRNSTTPLLLNYRPMAFWCQAQNGRSWDSAPDIVYPPGAGSGGGGGAVEEAGTTSAKPSAARNWAASLPTRAPLTKPQGNWKHSLRTGAEPTTTRASALMRPTAPYGPS